MAVTVAEASAELNIAVPTGAALSELNIYIAAANEWMSTKVSASQEASYPNLVKLATLFLIGHLWESQRGPAATPLAGDEIVMVSGRGFAVPNRVLELIAAVRGPVAPTYSFPDAVAWPDSVEASAP